jgi:hypothetical protein
VRFGGSACPVVTERAPAREWVRQWSERARERERERESVCVCVGVWVGATGRASVAVRSGSSLGEVQVREPWTGGRTIRKVLIARGQIE